MARAGIGARQENKEKQSLSAPKRFIVPPVTQLPIMGCQITLTGARRHVRLRMSQVTGAVAIDGEEATE